ncbi:MAG TPA: 6-carboxytetrahydropterin synthase [Methanomassiliicoccales archaeon]|nr:6-carboxytetrahydropterin synthase [Methanomassiliicoccales archaeon]
MYSVSAERSLRARHAMPGGKASERREHEHEYTVRATLRGRTLDDNGFLTDVDALDLQLKSALEGFRGTLLNEAPELQGRMPSMEVFAEMIWERMAEGLGKERLESMEIIVSESPTISASHARSFAD